MIRQLLHWIFAYPAHHHLYAYHALRDEAGAVRFFWKCTYLFCGAEIQDDEAYGDD